jgi:hypothetical protein
VSTETSPLSGPNTLTILDGAVAAIRTSPAVLGLFLLSGILRFFLPHDIDSVLRLVFVIIGVVIVSRALGIEIPVNLSFILQMFIALLTTLVPYLLFVVGILSLLLPGMYGWIGFFTLMSLGIYIYVRLFLSTPAVMIDGYGPAESLAVSWRLMSGSIIATTFALILVLFGAAVALGSVLWFIDSGFILNVGGILIIDTLLAATQAFLYLTLNDTPRPNQPLQLGN